MEEKSLILEGLPDDFDRVKSKVELYFKNKRRSGGEIGEIREHQDDKRKALLIYMREEDLKKVLDKRIHKVDFRSMGTVEVTVKLPEDTKSKKIKPQVLPKPKLEKSALLKSLPAPANQVSAVRQPATEIKDNEKDSEIPDLLITTPSLTSVDKETLQMYFEQFTEQFELAKHGNNSWILKLYSLSDFKEIFGKEEHDIGVSLQVYNEGSLGEKSDPRRFILTGFDGDTDCKKISVFIGSCSKTPEYTWETLDEDDRIVVTFKQDIDVKSFIRKCTSKQLQGRDIGVTRMERTDSILVQGDLEKISEDILTLYFSNKKKSRGGDIQNFIWINRRMSAVITFGNCDDAHATVEQKHSVCGTDVHASLFYSSLQKALTGKKHTLTDITTKVNVSASEDLLRFFETNERCRKQLESDAKLLHAKVLIDSEIILEMDVNKESLTALRIAPTWESKISRGVDSFLSGFGTEELKVEEDVWRKVEKDCDALVTVDTSLSFKALDSKVVISGVKEQVRILSDKISVLLKNAAFELEIERNTIEATIQLDCIEAFDLIKERVHSKLGQVTLSHDEKQHIISLKGLKENVNPVEMLIKNAQKNIITHRMKLSPHLIDFLKSLDLLKFEQDKHIPARFLNRTDFFGILVETENLKVAEDKIGEILKEEVIQISPNQTGLTNFVRNLQDEIKDVRIAQSNAQVVICGISNAVSDVAGKLRRYLENKEATTENVPLRSLREVEFVDSCLNLSDLPEVKRLGASVLPHKAADSPCVRVTAPKENIKDAADVVRRELSSIVVEKHKYGKAGEAKVLEKHEDNVKTKAKEKQCNVYLSQQEHAVALPKSFAHKIGDFATLSIVEGDLHLFTADALICTMSGNLDFENPAARRFLAFGGDAISEVCKTPKKEKQSLLPGDVLVSDAGKLNAEMLIYAVLPRKGQALDSNYLQASVRNCLLKAEGKGCVSVAMPAFGCETFGFSVKESWVAMRAAVLQFCQDSRQNVRDITVVDSDEKIVEEFNALIQEQGFPDIPLQSRKVKYGSDKRVRINGVPICLKKGDITKETVDVIVNSSNQSLDLNTGVSGAILKAAGKSVVDECKKLAPLKAGSAVMTSAGALRCKHIAQMVGPGNVADITASLGKVLNLCEGKMATTLAIPAIGTGRGGFEPRESVKAIFTAIEKHLKEPNSSCFRSITIVAYEQNQKTFDDFREYFKQWNKPACNKMPENQVKIGGVRIEVKKGDITTETVRGIVNTTNRDMSLRGGVSGAIFKAAGASVEQECQKHGPLQNDVAAVTSGGNLQCDVIIHMVGPHSAAETRSRVKKVLERCEEKQITTLSFPAVGTGGGGVQAADAIAAMLEAFEDHLTPNVSTVIKLIYIVINQDNILQEFQRGLKTWAAKAQESEDEDEDDDGEDDDDEDDVDSIIFSTEESSSSDEEADASGNPMEMIIGPIKVKVFSGDITKETVEAIVNSTNTTLNLNSGVSGTILKASGQTVVNECKTKAPQPADGVILTKAGNLSNIKHIVQMVGQTSEKGISSSVYKVLTMCEENHIRSVSFPALGTGAGNLMASGVANAMTEALMKFVKDSPKHLKVVHIVIFQAKLLPAFQEAVKKCKKISRKASVRQQTPVSRTRLPTLCLAKETASVSFPVMSVEVYGTSHANLAEVKRILDELISDECVSKDIQSRHIADLPETDKKDIVSLSRANQVSVLVTGLDTLTVSGKKDDVLDAVLKINGFMQAAQERETRAGEVKRLRDMLCWERARGERWEPLGNAVSYDFELAFHRKLKSFQYQENGESYTVDFSEMMLTNSKKESCRIKRTLLGDSETAIIHPPPTWTKMDGRDLEIITLQSDSSEYKKIKTDFLSSSLHQDVPPLQVQQIDRIQSQSQWQRYCVLKQAVDKKYPKQTNERMLYHGTTKDICQKINKNGFNRSFCGRNAVVHGDGTYFARDAWYSCQDQYSNADDQGLKYVYRARVVTGSLCKSRQGMKEPDPIRPGDPRAGLHDCAVDSLTNPFIFVVFCDAGAYPEYLITFKTK